jgi:hypothetical protein
MCSLYEYQSSECETFSGAKLYTLTERQLKSNSGYLSIIICNVPGVR